MTFFSNPKRKYVLNPRGTALYEDSNRFGTKMLEKMGWSKGKGLGADLNGQQDFVKVSYKSDQKGFGYTEQDNQWTQHEDQFNSLLKSFDNSKSNSADDQLAADQQTIGTRTSGMSLEELSKKSRARVHYKKFTRGKDMTRYNDKDLANIFGRRTLDEPTASVEPMLENGHKDTDVFDEITTPNFGITTIETGISVNDYFRRKLAAVRGENINSNDNQIDESPDFESTKKSKKAQKEVDADESLTVRDPGRKKKKRKNRDRTEETAALEPENITDEQPHISPKKSKRKAKQQAIEWNDLPMAICDEENSPPKPAKESKRNKHIPDLDESKDEWLETVDRAKTEDEITESGADGTLPSTAYTELQLGKYVDSLVNLAHIFAKGRSDENDSELQSMSLQTTYGITSFKAELFRFLNFNGFNNSSLTQITGYGYASDLQLTVTASAKDESRLSNFWDKALEQKYGANVLKAKAKKRYSIARLQKKNMFKGIS